ncbi:unnamed protein product [Onchocerca flexuosa]|uniref:Ovule protein n=1 Tax=Onchocerca flexuosa TaxID=387005 RepID=A0A183HV29_9BILA|nr:unnamed protein product [Onchocerca flexuosa]
MDQKYKEVLTHHVYFGHRGNVIIMSSQIVALVVIFTHADVNQHKHKCRRHEIWTECVGCELKCGQSEFVSDSKLINIDSFTNWSLGRSVDNYS